MTEDEARGGHFVVMEVLRDREWHVKAFNCHGNLMMHTWHTSRVSMLVERAAWLSRGAEEWANV